MELRNLHRSGPCKNKCLYRHNPLAPAVITREGVSALLLLVEKPSCGAVRCAYLIPVVRLEGGEAARGRALLHVPHDHAPVQEAGGRQLFKTGDRGWGDNSGGGGGDGTKRRRETAGQGIVGVEWGGA